ncbi:Alpha/beta hydrolase family protein [Novipirellula galeiformis]|uniref:Alpha/beta hydrolase family protein n=1 Tax=Novipirellula galeiformis TaxID=2528004 RepID=A0A5C6CL60_9BACT|nr:alpha/beta hydrolase [Novipirellula galeiformis]TWU23876.1 Alpha/beta hydrolase family protein [Novipirellula galeiformis]
MRTFILITLLLLTLGSNRGESQPPTSAISSEDSQRVAPSESIEKPREQESLETVAGTNPFSLLNKTAGGTQCWTDHCWVEGYRIQQNSLTGHWRLLSKDNTRLTWGTRSHCEACLSERIAEAPSSPHPERVIVLVHGLMRSHHSMARLERDLKQRDDALIIRFSYASTRCSIRDHAAALRELLERLPEETKISFVGHSMGNIVTRHLIGDLQRHGDAKNLLTRCESMVMLGPPNQGAAIARRLNSAGIFDVVTGKSCRELGADWDGLADHLATPPFPFAIVAGDLSSHPIQNPLVEGASDYVVSLEEAKLDGAEAFYTVPVLHSFLMKNELARSFTIDFLISHRS